MRVHLGSALLLTLACCLVGQISWAQRTAVAPLMPLAPIVQLAAPMGQVQGVQINRQPARSPSVAPDAAAQSARHAWPQPVYLLNSRVIVSELDVISPRDIAKIDVYKVPAVPTPIKWRSLTEHGIVDIQLKPGVKLKLKTESLAAIRRQLKLSGSVIFELNGMRLEDESLRIAESAIAGLDVLRDDAETVVNIRLAPPKPTSPHNYPPGTILIRGIAGR